MEAGDLSLQAGDLLQLIERHDERAGFQRRAAMIDADVLKAHP